MVLVEPPVAESPAGRPPPPPPVRPRARPRPRVRPRPRQPSRRRCGDIPHTGRSPSTRDSPCTGTDDRGWGTSRTRRTRRMCVNVSGSTRRTDSRNRSKVRGAPPPVPPLAFSDRVRVWSRRWALSHQGRSRVDARRPTRRLARGGCLRGGVPARLSERVRRGEDSAPGAPLQSGPACRISDTRDAFRGWFPCDAARTRGTPRDRTPTPRDRGECAFQARARARTRTARALRPGVSSAIVEGAREESEVRPARGCVRGGEGVDEGGADEGIGGGWMVLRGWRRRGSGGGSGEDERRGKFGEKWSISSSSSRFSRRRSAYSRGRSCRGIHGAPRTRQGGDGTLGDTRDSGTCRRRP